MDDVAWGALALALTLVSGCVTWIRAQRHGAATAVRWAGITLLPLAAYFTHTLRLLGRIGTAVSDWAIGFVWNPFVWLGLVMAVLGIGLTSLPEYGRMVVLGEGAAALALAVDAVEGLERGDLDELAPPPTSLGAATRALLRGVDPSGLAVLDAKALLASERLIVDVPVPRADRS